MRSQGESGEKRFQVSMSFASRSEFSAPDGLMRKGSFSFFGKTFLQILSTEGRDVRLCWEQSKPRGRNIFRAE